MNTREKKTYAYFNKKGEFIGKKSLLNRGRGRPRETLGEIIKIDPSLNGFTKDVVFDIAQRHH